MLWEPCILLEMGNALIKAVARCKVAFPLLGKVMSIQCNVRRATGLVQGMTGEAQGLREGVSWASWCQGALRGPYQGVVILVRVITASAGDAESCLRVVLLEV